MAITSGQRPIPITTSSALTIIGSGDSGTTLTASLAFWTGSVIRSESLGWYKNSVASGTSSIYYTIQDSDNNSTLYYGQAAYNRIQTATAFSNTKSIQFLDFYALGDFSTYNLPRKSYYARILGASGSDDTVFRAQSGSNNAIYTGYQQSDGKLVIGGAFTTFSGSTAKGLARVNLDGTVDTTFNTGTGLSTGGWLNTTVTQSDGKIIIAGNFTTYSGSTANCVARINTNGTIDPTFNTGAGTNSSINSVIIQPDGKILLGGWFTTYSGSVANRIVRVNADGTIDNTFVTGTGFADTVYAMVRQSDGTILVGKGPGTYNGTYSYSPVKLSSVGTLDVTYPAAGTYGGTIRSMALQPDGKLVVGAQSAASSGYRGIRRYLANGSADPTFALGTTQTNGFDENTQGVLSVTIQPDGKILAGGDFRFYSGSVAKGIIRFSNSGALDTTFDTGVGFDFTVYSVVPLLDGRIFVGGAFSSYNELNARGIVLIDKQGSQKAGFNSGMGIGYLRAAPFPSIMSAAKTTTGKIVAVGSFDTYSGSRLDKYSNMVAINPDGTADAAFSTGEGFVYNSNLTTPNMIITQSNGNLLVTGNFSTYSGSASTGVVSVDLNGRIDKTFKTGGGVFGGNQRAYGVVKQTDGKVIITGDFTSYGGNYTPGIVMLTDSGSVSSSFNTGTGFERLSGAGYKIPGYVVAAATQSDGKILVGGSYTIYSGSAVNNLVRINTDGTLDSSFNIGAANNGSVEAIYTQADNKIVLGGAFSTYSGSTSSGIVRVNQDGTIDTSFKVGTGFNGSPSVIKQQSDGKLLVAGNFTTYSGSTARGICRINTSGSLDSTFNSGTSFNNLYIIDMALQSDGKIIVVGYFASYGGVSSNEIVRINTDGSRDSSYNVGTGFTGFAAYTTSIQVLPDGKALAAHRHTSYSGSVSNGLTRINTDGTKDDSFVVTSSIAQYTTLTQARQQPDGKMLLSINGAYYSGSLRDSLIRVNQDGTVDGSFTLPGLNSNVAQGSSGIIILPNGYILAVGNFLRTGQSRVSNVFRANADGTVDNTFNAGAGLAGGPYASPYAFAAHQQADGKILLGGGFRSYSGSRATGSVRINQDGTMDTTYNPGVLSSNTAILAITQQSDGKILLGGSFTSYSGSTANRIVRVNQDGTRDTTFNIGAGFNDSVNSIVQASSGEIVIGGRFSTYSGSVCGSVVRLNLSGALDTSLVMPQSGLGVTNALIQK